jgi:hypothetical protein
VQVRTARSQRRDRGMILDKIWIGEGRWKELKRWFTLWSTCRPTRKSATEALKNHPNYSSLDKTRVKKFLKVDIGKEVHDIHVEEQKHGK